VVEKSNPIGIFDSGVGGLSIAAAVHRLFPAESLLYFADRANFPYGGRSEEQVRHLARAAAQFLIGQDAKLVVVACNTASSVALPLLRSRFSVPFVGVVPGVKPGSAVSRAAHVGVLATATTFQTRVFSELTEQFAEGVEIRCQVCPDLVALVEAGEVDSPRVDALIARDLAPLVEAGVDTLVLGCTHYSFLVRALKRAAPLGVTIIDTAVPVARQVGRVLEERGLLNPPGCQGSVRLCASDSEEEFRRVAEKLWPQAAASAAIGLRR